MVPSLAIRLEDRRIAGHLRAVERLLRDRDTGGLSRSLKRRRIEMLDRLAGYSERGVFPRNCSGSFLTPVFVDSDGRECAVAHLMGGDVDSVGEISGSHNLARIKEIPHPALATWQQRSGLDLDELALIQPIYPETASSVATAAVPGLVVFLVGMVGTWASHGVRRIRFRLDGASPNNRVVVFSVVAALAGWWLIGEARRAWALPGWGEGSYAWVSAKRDVAFEVVVWLLIALGALGVVFGLATVLRRLAGLASWKGSDGSRNPNESLQRGTRLLTRACLALLGPLVWAWAVTTATYLLSNGRLCTSGRPTLSQWLPLPQTRCVLDGEIVATNYADTLFVLLALAPIVWVVARTLFRVQSQRSHPSSTS